MMRTEGPKPFLKWAGGKRWLVQNDHLLLPPKFNRYIEPFLGSGVLFFHLAPRIATLSDTNADLIDTYRALRAGWRKVHRRLQFHQANHSQSHYYATRSSIPGDAFARAARFIYLNRTCWNGLYRVNREGLFNVPIGTRDSVILPDDDFRAISTILRRARLVTSDFERIVDSARPGDLIFADPPYTVKHNLNGFVKYNQSLFSWEDQERLARALVRARRRGVWIVATNANHPSVRRLYAREFHVESLARKSMLASSSTRRGITTELFIRSYTHEDFE